MQLLSTWDSLGEAFKHFVDVAGTYVWSTPATLPWLVVLLLGAGIYVTIRMRGIQFRKLRHALRVVRGDFDNPEHEGDVSHFQALTTALSATVGIGNIAGVATAIHFGGAGALFWMWATAIFGMALKYTEVSLAMKYRDFDEAGNVAGGPQKYIEKLGPAFKPMAFFFAACAVISSFGAGNMNQINTMAQTMHSTFGIPDWVVGLFCAIFVGSVILGGIKRIGRVTSVLMPLMAILYFLSALGFLAINAGSISEAFATIFKEAFNPTAGFAGTAAGIWSTTLLWGVKRGLFSNESGQGSAPIAHAAAKTNEPLREGVVAMLGPLVDTLIICTLTGLVIVIAGDYQHGVEQQITLADKELVVMTWQQGKQVSLASFGKAVGRRGGGSVIEKAGYDGPVDGETKEDQAVKETLFIKNGLPDRIRHKNGQVTGALLARYDAPILFHTEDQLITRKGRPFTGSLEVMGGGIVKKDLGEKLNLRGLMVLNGADLTKHSFGTSLGSFGELMVTIAVLLFALSTAISWSYYGDRCAEYLFGFKAVRIYRFAFLGFVYLGAVLPLKTVWDFGDLALGAMTVPNLIAVIFLAGSVKKMQDSYFSRTHVPQD